MSTEADAFAHQNTEEYQAVREFTATARRLAGYLSDGYEDLSARLDRASTELALRIGATADGTLGDEDRSEHRAAARNEARNCSILLDIVSAMNLGYAGEDVAVARRHLLRVMRNLPAARKNGSPAT